MNINRHSWNYKDITWYEKYNLLVDYYNEHGNIDVPKKYEVKGVRLDTWLRYQRQAYSAGRLSRERILLLEKMGMKWKMKIITNVDDWNKNYKLLEEYYKEHGNIDVPSCYMVGDVRLGLWLKEQRYAYRRNNKFGNKMLKEHIELLNKLGMIWEKPEKTENNRETRIKYSWKNNYKLLEDYYKENGNINVPVKYIVEDIDLGEWLNVQRLAYKGIGKEKLNEEQISLLNKLGMNWAIKNKIKWNYYYKLLEEYYNKNGNIDVVYGYEVAGANLGRWVTNQRNAYNNKGLGKINEEQIELLNKLGMRWEIKPTSKWMDSYHILEEYYNEHGNIDVPCNYKMSGINLGRWLANQIQAYKGIGSFEIKEDQILLLEKLGINWFARNKNKWNRNYRLLKQYYEKYGDIDVPLAYEVDGVRLGVWLNNQRQAYKETSHHKISEEQIELLNKLGMKWELRTKTDNDSDNIEEDKETKTKTDEEKWLSFYKLLENYYQSFGHSDVPQIYAINSIKLGAWVQKQRKDKDKLTSLQIYLLEKLDFKWDIETELDWKECLELLNLYHKEHGDILVPRTYEKNGINLGLWLVEQRSLYKKSGAKGINPEVVKELNKLGFDWSRPITRNLNKKINNMQIYNKDLITRAELVLRDLTFEGINEINNEEDQKQITKEMFSRIWR